MMSVIMIGTHECREQTVDGKDFVEVQARILGRHLVGLWVTLSRRMTNEVTI